MGGRGLSLRSIQGHLAAISGIVEFMEPTEEQLTALGTYRDIIIQHVPEIAEAIGVSPQTLTGWTEGKGDPTSEQAAKILEFLTKKAKTR